MTRLDQNRSYGLISEKLRVKISQIKNIIVWGNHSSTQFPDVSHGSINIDGEKKSIKEVMNDESWIENEFVERV